MPRTCWVYLKCDEPLSRKDGGTDLRSSIYVVSEVVRVGIGGLR